MADQRMQIVIDLDDAAARGKLRDLDAATGQVGTTATTMGGTVDKALAKVQASTVDTQKSAMDLHHSMLAAFEDPMAAMKSFGQSLSADVLDVLGPAGIAAGVLSGAMVGLGLALMDATEKAAKTGATLYEEGLKTGIVIPVLSKLSQAAQIAGTDVGEIGRALFMFDQRVSESGDTVSRGMSKIGLSFTEVMKQSPDQQLLNIAHALREVTDPVTRNGAAFEIFGRSARDLTPLLLDLDAAMAKTAGLNVFTAEDAHAAKNYEMEVAALKLAFEGLSLEIGKTFIPLVTEAVTFAHGSIGWFLTESPFATGLVGAVGVLGEIKAIGTALNTPANPLGTPPAPAAPASFTVAPGIDASAKAMAAAAIAADDLNAHLATLRETILPLNAVQEEEATIMLAAGDKVETVAKYLQVAVPVVQQFAESQKQSAAAIKVFDQALAHIVSIQATAYQTMLTIDGQTVEGIKYYLQRGASIEDLVKVYGVLKPQVDAVAQVMKFESSVLDATTKSFKDQQGTVGLLAPRYSDLHEVLTGVDDVTGDLASTMISSRTATFGFADAEAYATEQTEGLRRALHDTKSTWGETMTTLGQASDVLSVIPGDFAKVAKAGVDAASDIMQAYAAGGGGLTGAINAAVAGVVDLGKALVGLGGPSKDELAARDTFDKFQKQYGSLDGTIKAVGKAYTDTGHSAVEAQRDMQAALDATHVSSEAEAAALAKINGVLDEQKQHISDVAKAGASIIGDVNAVMTGLGTTIGTTKQGLNDLGTQAVGAFAAAVAGGQSEAAALAALHPALQQLEDQYKKTGIAVDNVALGQLMFRDELVTNNPALMAAISGLTGEFDALNTMGLVNKATLESMERTGNTTFTTLLGKVKELGGSDVDALGPMQKFLHDAEDAAKKLGIPLDDNTKKLIDQSEKAGIWQDALTPQQQLLDGMQSLVDKVQDLIDRLNGIPPKINTTVTTTHEDIYQNGQPPDNNQYTGNYWDTSGAQPMPMAAGGYVTPAGIQYLASGNLVKPLSWMARGTDTVRAMLTPGEGVVNTAGMKRLGTDGLRALNSGAQAPSGGGDVYVTVNVAGSIRSDREITEIVGRELKGQLDRRRRAS